METAEQAMSKAEETYYNYYDKLDSTADDDGKLEEYYEAYCDAEKKYNELLDEYNRRYQLTESNIASKVKSYESDIKKQEQKMKEYSYMMEEYKTDTLDPYSEKMSDYKTDVMEPYSDMISEYRVEYDDFKTDFQDKYGNLDAEGIDEKISSLASSVESDSLSIDMANNNYSQTGVSAEQKRDSAKTKAELAKDVYDNTVAQINSDLQNKKEEYDAVTEEYNTFLEEIDAGGYVFASCSGIISSVSASEGDSYMANQNIAVIMDS